MFLKYGSYTHANHEASVSISRTNRFDAGRRRFSAVERWNIAGRLSITDTGVEATNHASLTVAIDALKAAYAIQGQNLGLYLNDGSTVTSHALTSGNCIGGVRIVEGPSFPVGAGAEYSTFRNYTLVVEGEILVASGLIDWRESLTYVGGGPRFLHLQTLNGLPQKQRVADATPYRVIQSGVAIGATGYPAYPNPIWPAAELPDQRVITRTTPRRSGTAGGVVTYTEFEITWQYTFEDAAALNANPSLWLG